MIRLARACLVALFAVSVPAIAAAGERCVRLDGLTPPAEAARRTGGSRARAIELLRGEAQAAARTLSADGPRVVLWVAGMACDISAPAVPRAPEPVPPPLAADPAVPPEAPLDLLRIPEAWARGITGQGVVVALIDTGIDLAHPDLAGHLWTNPGEIAGNGLDDDGNGFADDVHGWNFRDGTGDVQEPATGGYGHGTRSAGLVAGDGSGGKRVGAAPGVQLMVLRRGTGEAAMWAAAQYALENGAAVISQSSSLEWQFRPDYAGWRRLAETELALGVVRANAAGNTGTYLDLDPVPYNINAPANCPPPWLPPDQVPRGGVSSVVAVGNVAAATGLIGPTSPYGPAEWTDIRAERDPTWPHEMPAEFRDYPAFGGQAGLLKPDLVAPGDGSLSTKLGGGYEVHDGTSAATPRVAGILALLRQAVPGASPAELYRALVTTARDLGPAGRDNRYGAGLPDAAAALDALGPPLAIAGHAVLDPAPWGDADGGTDAGEVVRLALTLRNTSDTALEGVEVVVRGASGALVRDGWAALGALPPGASADTAAPHLGLELPAGSCGARVTLELELRAGGARRTESLALDVGTAQWTPLLATDFETDPGFTAGGTAVRGQWVRAVPVGTAVAGQPANPPVDASPDPGRACYVTGNGSTTPAAADVDGGSATLTSPAFGAAGFARVELDYARWFFSDDPGGTDAFTVEASPDDGATWTVLERFTARENAWRPRHLVLSDRIVPGARTRIRFTVADTGADAIVEGGVDDVRVNGLTLACAPYTPPADPPVSLGASLRLARRGAHVELAWDPPAALGRDPVGGYRVTSSAAPAGDFIERARPATARWVDVDGALAPGAVFYLVEPVP